MGVCACGLRAFGDAELEVAPDPQPARSGKPYEIRCEVTWPGAPDEYLVLPPEVSPIDWGSVSVTQARTYVRDGVNAVAFSVVITSAAPGEYETPEIAITVLSPDELKPPEGPGQVAAPTADPSGPEVLPQLRATSFTLRVTPDRTLAWVSGGIGASTILSIVAVLWGVTLRRRRKAAAAPARSESPGPRPDTIAAARQALETSSRRRIDGDHYEFYIELARAAELTGTESGGLAESLRARAKEVGYRNVSPTVDQMDGDFREVERAIEAFGMHKP